ncbi:MAG: hypothetical protein ACKVIX_06880 [Sphingomonadales bacterium]
MKYLIKAILGVFIGLFSFDISLSWASKNHNDLVNLFQDWRMFEKPPLYNGAPDYRAETFATRYQEFKTFQNRLNNIDIVDWEVKDQVDWHIIRAELNGFDFNHRVLKPWVRDPAFYKTIWTAKSDVPAHEGPTNHGTLELWTYNFPLSTREKQRFISELTIIPSFLAQAKKNLKGTAHDLWITGIRDIKEQRQSLIRLQDNLGIKASGEIKEAIEVALVATDYFINWLEAEAQSKTGPSGIGKDNYTWYQQNVHLVPLTWEEEVIILKRELDRAWSSLKLEEHRNRNLPPLIAASNQEEYEALANKSADSLMAFLKNQQIVTVPDYFEPALRGQLGEFVPEDTRNFFQIGSHFDPTPLFSHFYHWFELAIMDEDPNPNPIRRGALLYNIYDSRNEGTATAVEEMFMHAGLYDKNPRAREIVWIMVAQRAARGLGSLYAHANEMTMAEAGEIHMEWTPRGWMKTEPELRIFEQHLYLRQPGYGTSYITGKYLLERTLADYGKLKEERGEIFELHEFFDELNSIGGIPISLGRWQMTGEGEEILRILNKKIS